jgi:hypothetical protein
MRVPPAVLCAVARMIAEPFGETLSRFPDRPPTITGHDVCAARTNLMSKISTLGIAVLAAVALASCSGSVFSLDVGDCFDLPSSVEVSDVDKVDCSEPHDHEVYRLFDVPNGSYPGDALLDESASDGCFDSFSSYVGRGYPSSSLDVTWLRPTSESWDQGDREIVCILYDFDYDKLVGSMEGSGA